jgi:hypothetical protein
LYFPKLRPSGKGQTSLDEKREKEFCGVVVEKKASSHSITTLQPRLGKGFFPLLLHLFLRLLLLLLFLPFSFSFSSFFLLCWLLLLLLLLFFPLVLLKRVRTS